MRSAATEEAFSQQKIPYRRQHIKDKKCVNQRLAHYSRQPRTGYRAYGDKSQQREQDG